MAKHKPTYDYTLIYAFSIDDTSIRDKIAISCM